MPQLLRTIIESDVFERCKGDIEPDARRFDELMETIGWAICTNPYHFAAVPNTRLRVLKTRPFDGAPELRVYFTVEDEAETCTLCWIERVPPAFEEEDDSDDIPF